MRTTKAVLFGLAAILLGGVLLFNGVREYRQSRRLQTEGQSVTATVVDERTVHRTKGRSRYYLTVEFETEARQAITRELKVSRSTHTDGVADRSIKVHFLPNDLSVIQGGPSVDVSWASIPFGLLILGGGVVLIVFRKQPTNRRELAESTAENLAALCDTNQQYVPADALQFKRVDMVFYDDSQRLLERLGFVFLEDVEVIPNKPNKSFARTFLRVMLSADRTRIATIFHLKPGWMLRLLGAKETRVYGIDTQLSDNSFICTDNAESCNALNNPPTISVSHLPATTSVGLVLEAHNNRVEAHTVFRVGALPVRMQSAEDVRRSMDLQQRIKAAFRTEAGLSKEELERLAGATNDPVVNNLADDLKQPREPSRRRAG